MMKNYTLFISDLHLCFDHPNRLELLQQLLEAHAGTADAIYILGDLFDLWLGDDDLTEFNQAVIQAMRQCFNKGTPIYYMLGNHDSMIGRRFFEKSKAYKIKDPTVINLYQKPILICHGDSLCTLDHSHIRFRKILHNSFIIKFFTWLPLSMRKIIANHFNNHPTDQYANDNPKYLPPQTEINQLLSQTDTNFIIHGHTHRPQIQYFQLANQNATRIVLGYWGHEAQILKYYDDHSYDLIKLNPQKT